MTALKMAPLCALILTGAAATARADVTADEVWQDWQAGARHLGETRIETGAEERAEGRLTVTDLVLTMTGDEGEVVVRVPQIAFVETGTGTVEVILPDSYPIAISGTDEEGVMTQIDLAVQQTGLDLTVSGAPEAMRYDYAATRYAIALERLVEDGAPVAAEAMLALNALRGSYLSQTGPSGDRSTDYDIAAETLELSIESEGGEAAGAMAIDASVADVALSGRLALPEGMEEAEALPEGFALAFDYATGPALVEFDGEGPQGRAAGTARTASSEMQLSLDPARAAYASSTKGLDLALTEGPMPFPIDLSVAEYGFGLDAPLAADAAPQDLSARVTLDGLTLGEPVWALIDPGKLLPRTPATLIAELSGSARLPQDLADLDTARAVGEEEALAEAAPEIESLTLDRLVLRLAGAEILGDGAFTFDNTDVETFPGLPRPEGRIDLRATGLNGLLENLSKIGLIPAEQLMGPRMMLGLFTTTVGNDELTSEIVIDEAGQVLANGQRIR